MTHDPEPYLILHKVRGEPAFDIAHQIEMEGEECWIVGTSGHRAYPWFHQPLSDLVQDDLMSVTAAMLGDIPDHYTTRSAPAEDKVSAKFLLTSLGLPTKVHNAVQGTLKRRV